MITLDKFDDLSALDALDDFSALDEFFDDGYRYQRKQKMSAGRCPDPATRPALAIHFRQRLFQWHL